VRAVKDHWRNLSDAQVKAVAASGGVIGIDAYPGHVVRGERGTMEDVALHMEHVAALVGDRHVALGLDFAGFDGPVVEDLGDASGYPRLAEFLLGRGWTRPRVEGVFHGNAARVLGEVLR